MKKLMLSLIMVILLCGLSTEASAWGGHYRYGGGRYYRNAGWWGLGGFVTGLAVGAYVTSLPPRYETIEVGGVPYYYYDGYYYQAGPGGYVVVAPPTTIVQGQAPVVQGQANPIDATSGSAMVPILGTLVGILVAGRYWFIIKKDIY